MNAQPRTHLGGWSCSQSGCAVVCVVSLLVLLAPGLANAQESTTVDSSNHYEDQLLFVETEQTYSQLAEGPLRSKTKLFFLLGKTKKPITARSFFRVLERPDLVAEMDRRQRVKTGLIVSGLATIAASGGVLIVGSATRPYPDGCVNSASNYGVDYDDCSDANRQHWGWYGLASGSLLFAGVALTAGGIMKTTFPLSFRQARHLANEHNEDLRRRSEEGASRWHHPEPVKVDFGVGGLGRGGSIFVRARF